MNSIVTRATVISLALGATLFAFGGSARASHMSVELVGPAHVSVGQSADVRAVVTHAEDGEPAVGTIVRFFAKATVAGVTADVEIGSAVSGPDGAAVLNYAPRSAGSHELRAETVPQPGGEPAVASWAHEVEDGTPQLYRSTATVRVPGFDDRLIMVVVAGVWLILLSVAVRVIAIVRSGDEVAPAAGNVRSDHVASNPGGTR